MFAFLTLLVFLKSEASGIWTRVHNLVWLGEPGRDQAELKQEFEQRWTEIIDNMNIMMEFHEVPARFIKGQMIAMDTALWKLGEMECKTALGTYCAEIANNHGRMEDMREKTGNIWSCVVPKEFKKGCGGLAVGKTINIVGYNFFDTTKIGIYHEIGHNMGCWAHQTDYCPQEEYEAFAYATGKLPKTIMGGMKGTGCNKDEFEDFDEWRFLYFTDKNNEYCENGVCLPLGNEDFDCASKMRAQIEDFKSRSQNNCDNPGLNSELFDYCFYGNKLTCDLTNSFTVDFGDKKVEDCAVAMNEDPSLCPSKTFYLNKGKACVCCDTSTLSSGKRKIYVATPKETSSQKALSSVAAENERLKRANEALRQALLEMGQN